MLGRIAEVGKKRHNLHNIINQKEAAAAESFPPELANITLPCH